MRRRVLNENIKCYRKKLNPDATLKGWARCACHSGRKCKPEGPDWGPKSRAACNCGKPSCEGKTTFDSCYKCCKGKKDVKVRESEIGKRLITERCGCADENGHQVYTLCAGQDGGANVQPLGGEWCCGNRISVEKVCGDGCLDSDSWCGEGVKDKDKYDYDFKYGDDDSIDRETIEIMESELVNLISRVINEQNSSGPCSNNTIRANGMMGAPAPPHWIANMEALAASNNGCTKIVMKENSISNLMSSKIGTQPCTAPNGQLVSHVLNGQNPVWVAKLWAKTNWLNQSGSPFMRCATGECNNNTNDCN